VQHCVYSFSFVVAAAATVAVSVAFTDISATDTLTAKTRKLM